MKFAALLLLTSALALSQTPTPVYEIFGKVTEPGIGPISGVGVAIQGLSVGFTTNGAVTDAQGNYRVRLDKPGAYVVFSQKQGYSFDRTSNLTVDATHPKAEMNVELLRLGKITGRVIDDESREPLRGFEIFLVSRTEPAVPSGNLLRAATDADGIFVVNSLPPGDYLATTRRPALDRQWAYEVFKPEEAIATEQDYAESFWPGGTTFEMAVPAHLISGGFTDVGTILVHKTTLHRALLHMTSPCDASSMVEVEIFRLNSRLLGRTYPSSCKTDLLLLGLDRGSYLLHIHGPQLSALVPIKVIDKNLDLEIPLRPNVIIEGRWIPAQGMGPLPETLALSTRIEVMPGVFVNGATSERAQDNRFRLSVPPDKQLVAIRRLPGSPYASEIRYNDSVVRNGLLEVSPGAATHRLEIALDTRTGSISGDVTDGSRPAAGVTILLAPESYHGEFPLGQGIGTRSITDTNGHFDLADLIPGDYRIVATNSPDAFLDLLRTAQKVTLAPSGSQVVTLRLTK